MRKWNLAAVFAADPKVEHLARYPVRLGGVRSGGKAPSIATAAVNMDDTVTYSPVQWAAFQRLDPPLKLAMDAIQGNELTEPLGPPMLMSKKGKLTRMGSYDTKFGPQAVAKNRSKQQ